MRCVCAQTLCEVNWSHSVVSDSLRPLGLEYWQEYWSELPFPSPTHVHRVSDAIQTSHPLLSPSPPDLNLSSIRVFSNESVLASGIQSIGVLARALVLPMNIQDWFSLRLTGLISLQSKGLSRVFCNSTVQKHQFFGAQLSYSPTLTSIPDYWKNHNFD